MVELLYQEKDGRPIIGTFFILKNLSVLMTQGRKENVLTMHQQTQRRANPKVSVVEKTSDRFSKGHLYKKKSRAIIKSRILV